MMTSATVMARLAARRNEELVLAESALAGERRVAVARLAMALLFALGFELIPPLLGHEVPLDPVRIVTGLGYVLFAVSQIVLLRRVRPNPLLARYAPLLTTTVDFGLLSFMAIRDQANYGLIEPEMGAVAFAVVLCFSVARYSWFHVAFSTTLAVGCFLSIGLALDILNPLTTPFVVGGFLALGFLIGITNRSVQRMFRDLRRRDNLTRFLPQAVAERILAEGEAALTPLQREVTVLFSDIRGFTALSERLPPREVLTLLDEYFGRMTQVVMGHDGVVNKFLGDGMLAFWGVPEVEPAHAEKAVRAALDMQRSLAQLNQDRQSDGHPPLRIGIGIHTGTVAAGMLGGDGQHEYTVIGDAVNLASRIEALTKEHDADVLVSETTWKLCEGAFRGRRLAEESIRGRQEPVVLWAPAPE